MNNLTPPPAINHSTATTSNHQKTLSTIVEISGKGLHNGAPCSLALCPAPINSGINFIQIDDAGNREIIEADYHRVSDTQMCSKISKNDASIFTIEHLMAALWACKIDNAAIWVSGGEIPALDGSSLPFIEAIRIGGTATQSAPRKHLRLRKTVVATLGEASITLSPRPSEQTGISLNFTIDFPGSIIGRQELRFIEDSRTADGLGDHAASFLDQIAAARTFGFTRDADKLRHLGLALGADETNAVLVGDDAVLNPGGLRYSDEFVRHKILDCLGDLFLAGYRLTAEITCIRGGHKLTSLALHQLFSDPGNYEIVAAIPAL